MSTPTESPEIAVLAKLVRDGLDCDGLDCDDRVAQGLMMAARMLDREPDFYGAGGPAADQFWRHFNPHRIQADVAARRTLLDAALGWEHGAVEGRYRYHPCEALADPPGYCDCGRDVRVRAVLTALAAPYQTIDLDKEITTP